FAPSAAFLYDVDGFLRDWLLDLAAEQVHADGEVPRVVPDVLKMHDSGFTMDSPAIWSDAAVWVPWALWQAYGDVSVLDAQYDSMVAHVRRVAGLMEPNGLRVHGFQFADWLDPDAPPDQPWAAKADPRAVANAAYFRSFRMVADAARLTGRVDDAGELDELAERTRLGWIGEYVEADGRIRSDAPTVYALAIVFGLLDGGAAQRAGGRLAELVRANGHRIATGFAGTPYVTDALTMTGHVEDAYALLLQRECPSWLYTVGMGATTVWERWDSMLPDGSINPGEMTSFNHYALGAVADWLHRSVGGIAPLDPGYGRVLVAPRPGGGLTWARTSLDTRHGGVSVEWRIDADELAVDVVLPDGVTGVIDLDGHLPVDVEGSTSLTANVRRT
ncbi:MAG TPA: alpha-L-rhamnosidase C-terminal domain-containing protein, partial [Acidimicrobiales bacterium]|nr:alpha-L-rhamnosidase C-terminal domain-containing protein [Acidimicrobiales bacterium]